MGVVPGRRIRRSPGRIAVVRRPWMGVSMITEIATQIAPYLMFAAVAPFAALIAGGVLYAFKR